MLKIIFASCVACALGAAACTDETTAPPPSSHQPEAVPDDTADRPAENVAPAEGVHAVAVHYAVDPGDSQRVSVSTGVEEK